MSIIQKLVTALKQAWATEPTRVISLLASLIVFVFAKAGLVVNQATLLEALAFIVPLLVGGELTRSQVRPKQLRKAGLVKAESVRR